MTRSQIGWSRRAATLAAAAVLMLTAGCGSAKHTTQTSGSNSSGGVSGTIQVFAAASLTGTFTALGKQFEAAHSGVKVQFQFAASSALATQITQGAKADVFASASPSNMDAVVKANGASGPQNFAKNEMEIAVQPGNPKKIATVADLTKPGIKVALCQAQVPCGKTALKVFANAKVTVKPVTEQPDVKSTLTQVESGSVDAGVVYVTDVKAAASKVAGVVIPETVNANTEYPIAVCTASKNKTAAQAWVDFVLSASGQTVLSGAGFESP